MKTFISLVIVMSLGLLFIYVADIAVDNLMYEVFGVK